MTQYSMTSQCLTRDGKPWLPVMGEIHYSRYPAEYWEQELRKMAAGGVGIVSTYVIWIHHEEIEGSYDFSGQRNLRAFVLACAKCKLPLMLRIGPWCHGEVRNGGFPDWLMRKPFALRENSEGYLAAANAYYKKIFSQVKGLLHKDGGPIIGVQIENEYGHAGGLSGEAGEAHMRSLTALAKDAGFDVPYYTATGWGGAVIGDLLPVMGGYCDAPWDYRTTKLPPSGNYVFTHERNDTNIGSDRRIFDGLTFDPAIFPFLTAELGGGLQVTAHRRPVVSAADIAAMSMVKLGSGANLLGYYMYHGGTNPKGKLSTLQESKATGSPNDVPELSYDFQAPIREYGQITPTYREIRLLAIFLADFGEALCGMPAYIYGGANPSNLQDLRVSVRHDGKSGYVFVSNHQRLYDMAAHEGMEIEVELEDGKVSVPIPAVQNGDYFFLPFRFPLRYGRLLTANATPLCRLNAGEGDEKWVFYSQGEANMQLEDERDAVHLLVISRTQALDAWRIEGDQEYLVLCEDAIWQTDNGFVVEGDLTEDILVYPAADFTIPSYERGEDADGWAVYHAMGCVEATGGCSFVQVGDGRYELQLDGRADGFLAIDYLGDRVELWLDGEKVADDFYTGAGAWEVAVERICGVGKLGAAKRLTLVIYPFAREQEVYLQYPLVDEERYAAKLFSVRVRKVHRVEVMI